MIPKEKKEAVSLALKHTFKIDKFESISQIHVGLSSALTFKIIVLGKTYLLRVITSTDIMSDPTHYFTCMQLAADAGIAPKVLYTSIADRVSITEFIDAQPFSVDQARTLLPAVLSDLHSLPLFPYRVNYLDVCKAMIEKQYASPLLPELTEELLNQYRKINEVYPHDAGDWVSCHNDLKKDNILFDGRKAWLVDWEAAFLNDRYLDLAAISNFILTSEADELAFLTNYFGAPPNDYHLSRLFLMKQIVHLFCYVFCVSAARPIKTEGVTNETLNFRIFHKELWEEKINLGDNNAKLQYGLVHLEQFKENLLSPRFKQAINVVAKN